MSNSFNFRNPVRGQKGFTLVEVIVVAIIVAALAAVAIPLYTSYVSSSRKNAAANTAGSIASFCGACKNTNGTPNFTGLVAAPAGGGVVSCTGNTSTIQVPSDITITHAEGTPNTITGKHIADSTATATYNY